MGNELKIKCQPIEREKIDRWLREHRFFDRYLERYDAYEFRRPNNSDRKNMPNLDVRIVEDGIYVNNLDSSLLIYEIADFVLGECDRIEMFYL